MTCSRDHLLHDIQITTANDKFVIAVDNSKVVIVRACLFLILIVLHTAWCPPIYSSLIRFRKRSAVDSETAVASCMAGQKLSQ